MNFLTALFGGGDAVKAIGDTVDKLFTSDEERMERNNEMAKAKMQHDVEMAKIEAQLLTNQTDINKIEAASTSLFVAGWRPFVGWVGGFAFAYASIVEPLLRFGAVQAGYVGQFPAIDTDITMQVLLGLLGLGYFRTHEKVKGVS